MKTFLLLALIVSVQPNPIQLPLGGAPEFGFFDLIQDLCSSMSSAGHFNFEELMYDRMTETWTRNCSSVDSCAHGVSIEGFDFSFLFISNNAFLKHRKFRETININYF